MSDAGLTFHFNTKILIVDDLPSARELLRSQLRQLGYKQIFDAADGRAAYQEVITAKASQSPFELIISDLLMPEFSGLALLKMVRGTRGHENLPFIILTTDSEKSRIMEALSAGVSNYIMKPVDEVILKEKLSKTWQRVMPTKAR